MEVEELRVGNCIDIEYGEPGEREWGDIQIDDVTALLFIEQKKWKVRPLPLSEDWLLRFGFENLSISIQGAELWRKDKIYIHKSKGIYFFGWNLPNGHTTIEIKFVHKLQNLYSALTNTELQVKELETN